MSGLLRENTTIKKLRVPCRLCHFLLTRTGNKNRLSLCLLSSSSELCWRERVLFLEGKMDLPAATIILLQPWWLKYVSLASEGTCEDTTAHTTADDWEIVKHFKDVLISVFALSLSLSLSKIMHSWCRMHQVVHQDVFREEKHTYWWTFRWDSARSRRRRQQQQETKFHYKKQPSSMHYGSYYCEFWLWTLEPMS
jgi:hypothetical protein